MIKLNFVNRKTEVNAAAGDSIQFERTEKTQPKAVLVAVFIIICVLGGIWSFMDVYILANLRSQESSLKSAIQSEEKLYKELLETKHRTKEIKEIVSRLEHIEDAKIMWSRILYAIVSTIPDTMTLKNFKSDHRVEITYTEETEVKMVGKEKKVFTKKVPHEKNKRILILDGVIHDDDASLDQFVLSLRDALGNVMEKLAVTSVTTTEEKERAFVIECLFSERFNG